MGGWERRSSPGQLQLRRLCLFHLHLIDWQCFGTRCFPLVWRNVCFHHGCYVFQWSLQWPKNRIWTWSIFNRYVVALYNIEIFYCLLGYHGSKQPVHDGSHRNFSCRSSSGRNRSSDSWSQVIKITIACNQAFASYCFFVLIFFILSSNLTWRDVQHLVTWTSEYNPLRVCFDNLSLLIIFFLIVHLTFFMYELCGMIVG